MTVRDFDVEGLLLALATLCSLTSLPRGVDNGIADVLKLVGIDD